MASKRKPGRNVAESERHTVRVALRLKPDVADMLRARAREAGMTISDFVALLLSYRSDLT